MKLNEIQNIQTGCRRPSKIRRGQSKDGTRALASDCGADASLSNCLL
jgi:hypothetical protein